MASTHIIHKSTTLQFTGYHVADRFRYEITVWLPVSQHWWKFGSTVLDELAGEDRDEKERELWAIACAAIAEDGRG